MVWVFAGFGLAFIVVAVLVARKAPASDIDDFVVASRRLPFGIVSASVLVSWLWTTSLLGAAEAGYLFGIGGGFAFALGSAVPFFVFIPLALRLRRIMPEGTTFLEFIRQRYGKVTHYLFVALLLLLVLYICVEQIIGIAYAVSGSYDVSYSLVAICATIVVVSYIAIAGLRGAVINDVIQFFVISLVTLILIPIVLLNVGIENLYEGLVSAAEDPSSPVHTPGALTAWAPAALRYCAVAMVVSFGFVLLNQGYYSKARAAANNKSLLWAYIVGTVIAWMPIPILFGTIIGGVGLANELTVGQELDVSTDVAAYVFGENFGAAGVLLFSLVIFMAGLTTAGNTLAGFQATVSVDVQEDLVRQRQSAAVKKKRTQIATIILGAVVCVGALLLQGVSLLRIDIFSGIICATPVAALVAGLTSRRPSGTLAVSSIIIGLVAGVGAYLVIDDPDLNYFYGNLTSLLVPAIVIIVGSFFTSDRYDFRGLHSYRSRHHVAEQAPLNRGR